jgi:hypothetical protein
MVLSDLFSFFVVVFFFLPVLLYLGSPDGVVKTAENRQSRSRIKGIKANVML